jgi:hypothetical protein
MAQAKHITSAVDLFSKSYDLVKGNLPMFVLLSSASIVSVLTTSIQAITDDKVVKEDWKTAVASSFGPHISGGGIAGLGILLGVFILVSLVFSVMMSILSLRSAQGKRPNFDDLWAEFREKWFKLLLLIICLAVAVVAGFIALIIPGVILLWRLSMAPYIMIDKNTDISESIIQSWEITRGYAWPVYSIYLVSILLAITGIIPVIGGLIALVLSTVYICAIPLRYEEIKHAHHPKPKA